MSDHIILISCSNGKVRGGNAAYNPDDSITAFLPSDIQQTVWQRRRTIADWIIARASKSRTAFCSRFRPWKCETSP